LEVFYPLVINKILNIKMSEVKLGEYIYMGMGECAGERVCLSVAYKVDYCIKKARKFEELSKGLITFSKINKVKVGELKAEVELDVEGNLIS
jgi:hypothetical protein